MLGSMFIFAEKTKNFSGFGEPRASARGSWRKTRANGFLHLCYAYYLSERINMTQVSSKAMQIHSDAVVIDGLNISHWSDEAVYRRLAEGGITAINASVAVWEGTKQTLQNIGRFYRDFEVYSRYIRPVTSVADIRAAKGEGRTGVIFGFQNSSP